jgi:hypothetical protein
MTLYEEALESAAKELGRDKSDWSVEKLATLRLQLAVARHGWESTQEPGHSREMREVMDAIDALLKEVKPQEELRISLHFVEKPEGIYTCQHCHMENRLESGSYEPVEPRRRDFAPEAVNEPAQPAPVPAPSVAPAEPAPPDNIVPIDYAVRRTPSDGAYNAFGWMGHQLPTPGGIK